ncbi:MAG TPA: RNA polymerase sigma factor [Baekduia sp.]|nr:RNA polymerase sigma factor [Baekduia sp.]
MSVAGPLLRLRNDDQLVALFRAGHDEAFGAIHDRYRQRLFAYARQMLGGSRSDAEDVLQDVFLRAYDALRADGRPLALRAWLYRVAHNRCIDQLRRPAPAAEDIYDINRGVSFDLMAQAERREDLRRLIADVRALPEQQRSALLMREMEGLSYNELADALGVTVPAIKSLLVRARVGLVEAVEARDTACVEIRDDLASAFDRGVRASGRSRKHLRECGGCRDYRTALRGVEKALNGLAPASGPLTALAKILGIGSAGSGAAAGGGVVAVGGGGAGAAGAGVATTVGTGAVAATATKVAAVVAAAAVVGGGAATVEKVDRHHAPKANAAQVAPAAARSAPAVDTQRRVDLVVRHGGAAGGAAVTEHGAFRAPRAAHVRQTAAPAISSPGTDAPQVEETTGGVQAPDEAAPPTPGETTATGTDPGSSGTATTGTGTEADSVSGAGNAGAPSSPTGTTTGTTTTSSGGSAAPAAAEAPSGTVSHTPSAPMAQGATAPPTG